MQKYIAIILIFFIWNNCQAQKEDTLRKYLDRNLEFTSASKMAFPALAIRFNTHWMLYSVYPDTCILLKVFYADRSLTIKDGPFSLYHPSRIKAAEGMYLNNVKHGTWIFYYSNGQMKDSGELDHNRMTGTWHSWYENGNLQWVGNYLPPPSTNKAPKSSKSIVDRDTIISLKNGAWKSFYNNGTPLDSGTYINNKKSGNWTQWYASGKVESSGTYDHNLMSGEWRFYRSDGTLSTKEKYELNRITNLTCYDAAGDSTGISCSIAKPPVPQGRFTSLADYALDNIYWPENLPANIQGVVRVSYVVSKDGKIKDFQIIQTPHPSLSKEVEKFITTLEWSPAISHNRAIDYTMHFEVPFYR